MMFAPIGLTLVTGWGTSLLIRSHGLSLAAAAPIMAMMGGVFGPIGQFGGGVVGDKLAARKPGTQMYFAGGTLIAGALVGMVAALSPVTPVAIGCLALSVLTMLLHIGSMYALMLQLAPPGPRATIFAIIGSINNLVAYGGGMLLVGLISDRVGGPNSLQLGIALALTVVFIPGTLFIWLGRRLGRAA